MRGRPIHLVRRALTSVDNRPIAASERAAAASVLTAGEMALWEVMAPRDQRHSLEVLGRFVSVLPDATRAERAAALLHDVGKTRAGLGWCLRVVATLVGPRTRRFAAYHDHERIGSEMLSAVSDAQTVRLVAGDPTERAAEVLRRADDI